MVQKKIRCEICAGAMTSSRQEAEQTPSFALLNRKRWGQLTDASSDVVLILTAAERHFTVLEKQEKLSSLSSISSKISLSVMQFLFQKSD